MARLQPLVAITVVLGLVALAAFGVWQVIGGSGEAQQQPNPDSVEELQRLDEARNARDREAIQEFIDAGGDPCSLPTGEFQARYDLPYADLRALINDADLVVLGRPIGNFVDSPAPSSFGGSLLTILEVDDALNGAAPGPSITVAAVDAVMNGVGGLEHLVGIELDACASDRLLLFLNPTERPDEFSLPYQGWARVEGDAVEAGQLNHLFDDYDSAQALLDAVRQIAQEQQAQGLPKGRLVCESKRISVVYLDPVVCPGDTFNPYQTLRLDTADEALVVTADPGPSPRALGRTDLEPGSPQLSALLSALDVQAELEPEGARPDDLITLHVSTSEPANDHIDYVFEYSPSAEIVRMPLSGGQFPAPPAFQAAMEPFLAGR